MSVQDKLDALAALALRLEEAKEDKDSEENEKSLKKSEIETDDTEDSDSDDEETQKKEKAADKKVEEAKIDLGALFDGETLSEEFKLKATAVFEAAVAVRVKQEIEELEESFAQLALEESVELKESLVDKVDGYLDLMVEQWMKDNELAINRGVKTEILESFVSGMKDVFESHYIDVPDEKYDLVEAVQSESRELEELLDEAVAKNVELVAQLKEMSRMAQIEESCKDMAATDAERFKQLASELAYTDEFGNKLEAIKESYFKAPLVDKSDVINEEFMTDTPVEVISEEVAPKLDPSMAAYLRALER